MNFNNFMKRYAQQIGGQYSEYNSTVSIVIFPLPDERFQTVYGEKKYIKKYGRELIALHSKVCKYHEGIDLKLLLIESSNFSHAKFSIANNFVQVQASIFIDVVTEKIVAEIISEVANLADKYEFQLTGKDVH